MALDLRTFIGRSCSALALCSVFVVPVVSGCGGSEDEFDDELTDGPVIEEAEQAQLTATNSAGSVNVANGAYWNYQFQKTAGSRYTFCIFTSARDADLYGNSTPNPNSGSFQFRSILAGLTPDCIAFTATTTGPYYIGVKGFGAGGASTFTWRLTSDNHSAVPAYLAGRLRKPIPNLLLSSTKFSPFNSPWGNANAAYDPFFPGYASYYHNGSDFTAAANSAVTAACTGPIRRVGNLGGNPAWGYYVVQECVLPGGTVTVAYDHLNDVGRPAVGPNNVNAGARIGTIFDLNVAGEVDHLHFGVCANTWANCGAAVYNGAKLSGDPSWNNMISPEPAGLYAP